MSALSVAQVRYTSYRFRQPPLMSPEMFGHLKALPIRAGCLRYHPYDGFMRTFPGWCIFFGALVLVAACVRCFGSGEIKTLAFLIPFNFWFMFAGMSGALFSMFSWCGYYLDCRAYFNEYSRHLNEAKDYDELCRLRRGRHPEFPVDFFT